MVVLAFVITSKVHAYPLPPTVCSGAAAICAGKDDPPVAAGSLFVRCGLQTGRNDGSDHENAFRSWADVVNARKAQGQDMVFYDGTTCAVGTTQLNGWDGTASNPAIIGAYYMDGATPRLGYATKPKLNGSWSSRSCSSANACTVGFSGLIDIDNENDVIVQDLELSNWHGRGIDAEGLTASRGGTGNERITVRNVTIHHVAREGVLFKNTREYARIYDSRITNAAMCFKYKYKEQSPGDFQSCNVRPAALVFGFGQGLDDGDYPAVNIAQGNTVMSSWAEGIGCYLAGNCLIRNNIVGATWSAAIYMGHAPDFIVEGNIVMGDPNNTFGGAGRVPNGIGVGDEDFIGNEQTSYGTIRNNLIANVKGACFAGDNETENEKIDLEIYGNTCAYPGTGYVNFSNWPDTIKNDIRSNIFFGGARKTCDLPEEATVGYNVWDFTPSDPDCRGEGDVYNANPGFANHRNLAEAGPVNPDGTGGTILTDFRDAALRAGSPAIGAGDSSLVDSESCRLYADSTAFSHIDDAPLVRANWERCLHYDAQNKVRSAATYNAGAVEN